MTMTMGIGFLTKYFRHSDGKSIVMRYFSDYYSVWDVRSDCHGSNLV